MSKNGKLSVRRKKAEGFFSSENQSRRRKNQMIVEESMANKLRNEGYKIFSPTVVCDRIAVKDNKVYFVEFKKSGQKLREGQQIIHDLVKEMYLVVYSK